MAHDRGHLRFEREPRELGSTAGRRAQPSIAAHVEHPSVGDGERSRAQFLASMSYELCTPLHTVLGFAHLLLRDAGEPLTERQREMVERIREGAERLAALVSDALDSVESGGIEAGEIASESGASDERVSLREA
jgi:signal transduction histidine kinase